MVFEDKDELLVSNYNMVSIIYCLIIVGDLILVYLSNWKVFVVFC